MGMQRVIVTMPDELVAAIDEAAKREDRSRASVIRRACEAYWTPGRHIPPERSQLVELLDGHHGGEVVAVERQVMQYWIDGELYQHVGMNPATNRNVFRCQHTPIADVVKNEGHDFMPQKRNKLRCVVCGQNSSQHRLAVQRQEKV